MNVLLCLLGHSPGVVTGAYYALTHDQQVTIDRIVTLTTNHELAADCEGAIAKELRRYQRLNGTSVQYDETLCILSNDADIQMKNQSIYQQLAEQMQEHCRIRVLNEDVNTEQDVELFRTVLVTLLSHVYPNDHIYLSIAGGRKSMAGITAIAAQLYGHNVVGMYHLAIDEALEQHGEIRTLLRLEEAQRREILCPNPGAIELVEIPYLQVYEHNGVIRLALRGKPDTTLLTYLQQQSPLFKVLDQASLEKYLPYIFEQKVASYLEQQAGFTRAKAHFKIPEWHQNGDVDVYAWWEHPKGKFRRIVACECKLRLANQVDNEQLRGKVQQLIIKKRPAVEAHEFKEQQQDGIERRFEWWLVTNAEGISTDVIEYAKERNVQIHIASLPSNWKSSTEWSIPSIKSYTEI